jgi:hypothetical protein
MGQPGQFQPRGEDWMVRELQTLRRELNELRAANVFGRTGIMPRDGGTDFEGYVNINGEGVINGPLEVNGDSEFNGSLSINGPLFLQPGSIENDALTNPIKFDVGVNDTTAGLNVTLAEQTVCTFTLTVPTGFTQGFVSGFGSVGIMNPTAANSSIGGRVYIDRPNGQGPTWGPRRFQQALAGADASTFPLKQTLVTGLSGGQEITCRLVVLNTGPTDWGPTTGGASLNVSVYWTR